MNNLNDKYYLVYYLNEHFYFFELESTGNLIYKIFSNDMELMNKYTITNNHVINFSVTLDNNKIILIYLLKSGQLYLCINDGLNWTETQIGTMDTMSNLYHQFELLFANNKINLIYSYSNFINSEIISIHHLVLDKKIEEQNNVIKYILKKGYNEFSVDFDEMGTIHLIYNTTTNFESYIYHSFYSPYRGSWSSNPKELSTRGKENSRPYLFVDSKSNVNTAWLELNNSKYRLRYAKMPVNGKDKYIWQNINIPISFNNKFTPLICEEESILKILSYDSNSISTIISNDYGNTWANKGDKQISNMTSFIRTTVPNNLHPKLQVKDVLAQNSKVNDLYDLYIDFSIKDDHRASNIVNNLNHSSNLSDNTAGDLAIKEVDDIVLADNADDIKEVDQANKVHELDKLLIDKDELQLIIHKTIKDDKALINEILENQQLILDEILGKQQATLNEINELKAVIAEYKPSLINKLFK